MFQERAKWRFSEELSPDPPSAWRRALAQLLWGLTLIAMLAVVSGAVAYWAAANPSALQGLAGRVKALALARLATPTPASAVRAPAIEIPLEKEQAPPQRRLRPLPSETAGSDDAPFDASDAQDAAPTSVFAAAPSSQPLESQPASQLADASAAMAEPAETGEYAPLPQEPDTASAPVSPPNAIPDAPPTTADAPPDGAVVADSETDAPSAHAAAFAADEASSPPAARATPIVIAVAPALRSAPPIVARHNTPALPTRTPPPSLSVSPTPSPTPRAEVAVARPTPPPRPAVTRTPPHPAPTPIARVDPPRPLRPAPEAAPSATPQARPATAESSDVYRQALKAYSEGRKEDALVTLRLLLDKEPDRVPLRLQVGWLLVNLGRRDEARQLWNAGLARDPNNDTLLKALKSLDGGR